MPVSYMVHVYESGFTAKKEFGSICLGIGAQFCCAMDIPRFSMTGLVRFVRLIFSDRFPRQGIGQDAFKYRIST